MVYKLIKNIRKINVSYIYLVLILFSLYFTFTLSNIYFNSLSGADNYKYIENIFFIFGEEEKAYDNQGLFYFFYVAIFIKLRADTFNYSENSIFLSETIQLANLTLFIFGLLGYYFLSKKLNFHKNLSLLLIIFLIYFPSLYYLRLNMKPEILAFALIPWIFYFFENYLETKSKVDLFLIAIGSTILVTSKGSIAAMTAFCLLVKFLVHINSFNSKNVIIGFSILIICWFGVLGENYLLNIGNILDREPEKKYDNVAPFEFIYTLDVERLLKDPKKDYHKNSLFAITLIDLQNDYFELNWKEDSVLFSKNIKPLIVGSEKNPEKNYPRLFNIDWQSKNIIYAGPGQEYLIYFKDYIGLIISLVFLCLVLYYFYKESLTNKVYILFPFFGILILIINSIFGFPQNNFDPLVGDTLKVFYYSFLIPLPVLIVFKNLKRLKIKNMLFLILFIAFTIFNLGFPKANNEKFDLAIKSNVENTLFCEINSLFIEPTFITENKIECSEINPGNKISTSIRRIPIFSTCLYFLFFVCSLSRIKKNEK